MHAPWPSVEEITDLLVDELGMRILWSLVDQNDGKAQLRQSFIEAKTMQAYQSRRRPGQGMSATHSHEALRAEPAIARALAESWEWLIAEGLIAVDSVSIGVSTERLTDPYFVTRWGKEVAAEGGRGLDLTKARRRLGLELHQRLASPLKKLVRVGAFEQAAFVALREVEQRVGEMTNHPIGERGGRLKGEKLMNRAFAPDSGPLSDLEAELAEQQGQMNLFKGAFAAFRNPIGHRSIEFDDPTEAAEVVLLADLLMRQLDHISERQSHEANHSAVED